MTYHFERPTGESCAGLMGEGVGLKWSTEMSGGESNYGHK